mgnify:CR=1 FL=1
MGVPIPTNELPIVSANCPTFVLIWVCSPTIEFDRPATVEYGERISIAAGAGPANVSLKGTPGGTDSSVFRPHRLQQSARA